MANDKIAIKQTEIDLDKRTCKMIGSNGKFRSQLLNIELIIEERKQKSNTENKYFQLTSTTPLLCLCVCMDFFFHRCYFLFEFRNNNKTLTSSEFECVSVQLTFCVRLACQWLCSCSFNQ